MPKHIDIIIATYGRPAQLGTAIDSLLKQERISDFSYGIMVVDNKSDANTQKTVDAYRGSPIVVQCIVEPVQGKSRALNKAVAKTKGDIIAFTDDDAIVDRQWLWHLFQCFQTFDCDGVGGRVLPQYPRPTPQWIKDNATRLAGAVVIYEYGDVTKPLERSMYPLIGCNYAFRREMFDQCGLFREDLGPGTPVMGEDTEFVLRLMNQGKKIYYCGQALVEHPFDPSRLDLSHIARLHIALGRFDAWREKLEKKNLLSYSNVPRYLIRGVVEDFLCLIRCLWDKPTFYTAWRSLFRKVGMIKEYRKGKVIHA